MPGAALRLTAPSIGDQLPRGFFNGLRAIRELSSNAVRGSRGAADKCGLFHRSARSVLRIDGFEKCAVRITRQGDSGSLLFGSGS